MLRLKEPPVFKVYKYRLPAGETMSNPAAEGGTSPLVYQIFKAANDTKGAQPIGTWRPDGGSDVQVRCSDSAAADAFALRADDFKAYIIAQA